MFLILCRLKSILKMKTTKMKQSKKDLPTSNKIHQTNCIHQLHYWMNLRMVQRLQLIQLQYEESQKLEF